MTNEKNTVKKGVNVLKWTVILLLIAALVFAAGVYVAGAFYYSNKFFNGTMINGVLCSSKTVEQVKEELQKKAEIYDLTLKFLDSAPEIITGEDLGMVYEDNGEVDAIMASQNRWRWILDDNKKNEYEVAVNRSYKENIIDVILWDIPAFRAENQVQPADAYLKDCGTYYEIVPEVMGNALDEAKAKTAVINAIEAGKTEVDLQAEGCYNVPKVYKDDADLNSDMTQLNLLLQTNITYDFDDRKEVVDASVVKAWLYETEDGIWKVNSTKVEEFVQQMKRKYDTFGQTREFKTSLGKTVTLKGGDYGWVIKKQATADALAAAIAEGKTATMEPVYLYEGKCRATNDIGGTYIEVSIEDQRMWCYKDGQLIVDTPVVTGDITKEGRATPTGSVWAIDARVSPWTLRGADYETEVTYWLPFNGNVGVHDATWRSNFGGSIYKGDGSHGCINTPYDNAEKIYAAVRIGHPVIVY